MTASQIVLASASTARIRMLTAAGVTFRPHPARIDEQGLRDALASEGATPRDCADALAEHKAAKVSAKFPEALVIGCDQILDHEGESLGKPSDPDALRAQLLRLRGRTHRLWSAAVVYRDAAPLWRHVGEARMTMRSFSDDYLDDYLRRNGDDLMESVGGYRIEAEGIRLFDRIDGDYFTVLGLPLVPLLVWLGRAGVIAT
ncbi:MAG: Maf family protein [Gemmobacter sp.]